MTVNAVIFDIGNVLIGWQPEAWFDARIGEARRRALFRETALEAANLAVDAGAPMKGTMYALADRHPDWAPEIRMWHDNWLELVTPVIDHSVILLRRLRARGVPVFALTNFGDDTFALAQGHFDFLNEFDREYVSGRLKILKPDPALYAHVEADCGLPPGSLLFADDKPENIATATARGWQTHHFTDPQGWADRLVAAGLLTETEARP